MAEVYKWLIQQDHADFLARTSDHVKWWSLPTPETSSQKPRINYAVLWVIELFPFCFVNAQFKRTSVLITALPRRCWCQSVIPGHWMESRRWELLLFVSGLLARCSLFDNIWVQFNFVLFGREFRIEFVFGSETMLPRGEFTSDMHTLAKFHEYLQKFILTFKTNFFLEKEVY